MYLHTLPYAWDMERWIFWRGQPSVFSCLNPRSCTVSRSCLLLWNHVVGAICTLQFDVRLLLHRVEHMPGGRGRDMPWFARRPRLPIMGGGALPAVCSDRNISMSDDNGHAGPFGRPKLETLIDLGGLGGLYIQVQ